MNEKMQCFDGIVRNTRRVSDTLLPMKKNRDGKIRILSTEFTLVLFWQWCYWNEYMSGNIKNFRCLLFFSNFVNQSVSIKSPLTNSKWGLLWLGKFFDVMSIPLWTHLNYELRCFQRVSGREWHITWPLIFFSFIILDCCVPAPQPRLTLEHNKGFLHIQGWL